MHGNSSVVKVILTVQLKATSLSISGGASCLVGNFVVLDCLESLIFFLYLWADFCSQYCGAAKLCFACSKDIWIIIFYYSPLIQM